MRLHAPVRVSLLLCLAASLCAQTRRSPHPAPQAATPLPPVEPTAPPPPPTPAQSPPSPAKITGTADQLTISANNSSLDQVLHEVARIAGVTITGSVSDERVFGDYGPGPTSEVLNQLLDGTGVNMLFIGKAEDQPAQLILTPRNGGPTPPGPNATRNQDAESSPQVYPPPPPDSENVHPELQPGANPPPAPPATGTPSTASTDPNQQSPNGVKTPQQIYNDLMRLRQQQSQQQH